MNKPTTKPTSFRIPTDLLEKLKKVADEEGRSASNLLIKILKEQLK